MIITLIQPLIWLLLFGALFKAVTQIPGFSGRSYIDYLMPVQPALETASITTTPGVR